MEEISCTETSSISIEAALWTVRYPTLHWIHPKLLWIPFSWALTVNLNVLHKQMLPFCRHLLKNWDYSRTGFFDICFNSSSDWSASTRALISSFVAFPNFAKWYWKLVCASESLSSVTRTRICNLCRYRMFPLITAKSTSVSALAANTFPSQQSQHFGLEAVMSRFESLPDPFVRLPDDAPSSSSQECSASLVVSLGTAICAPSGKSARSVVFPP